MRYTRARLQDLRDEHGGVEVWEWDTWTIQRIGVDAHYAHQPQRRIYFTQIEPAWLRELAKRWARWQITQRHALARRDRRHHQRIAVLLLVGWPRSTRSTPRLGN